MGKVGYLTFKCGLNVILVKLDEVSKNFSFYVRTPFLYTKLVEIALDNVPGTTKIRGCKTKYILKRLPKKFLPPELPIDRKRGFNPPIIKVA